MSSVQFVPITEMADIRDDLRKPINNSERNRRVSGKSQEELYPYYGATGQVGWIDSFITDGEYVLVGEDGAPFFDFGRSKAYIINGKTWVNNHAHILRAKEGKSNNKFICHYLNFFNYEGYVNGTTRLKLTKGSLQQIPIPKFKPAEQDKIVQKIETLFLEIDSGTDELEKIKQKLELYKQSILNSAIQGKLVAQDLKHEPASKMLERIRAEKERLIKEKKLKKEKPLSPIDPSEVPFELPSGWTWVNFGEISKGFSYGTSQKCDYEIVGTPVLRIPNVGNEQIDTNDLKYTKLSKGDYEDLKLELGDILIIRSNGSVNLVGRAAVVNDSAVGIAYAGYLIRSRVFNGISPQYIHLCLRSFFLRNQIETFAKSTSGVNNVNAQELGRLMIPLPPTKEQSLIVETVDFIFKNNYEELPDIQGQLHSANLLKQSILKSAFEGKLL